MEAFNVESGTWSLSPFTLSNITPSPEWRCLATFIPLSYRLPSRGGCQSGLYMKILYSFFFPFSSLLFHVLGICDTFSCLGSGIHASMVHILFYPSGFVFFFFLIARWWRDGSILVVVWLLLFFFLPGLSPIVSHSCPDLLTGANFLWHPWSRAMMDIIL